MLIPVELVLQILLTRCGLGFPKLTVTAVARGKPISEYPRLFSLSLHPLLEYFLPWVCFPCGIFISAPLGFLGRDIRPWFDIYPAGFCVLKFHLICIRAAYPSGKPQPRSKLQAGAAPGIRERCKGGGWSPGD